jgi:hypothetical protein
MNQKEEQPNTQTSLINSSNNNNPSVEIVQEGTKKTSNKEKQKLILFGLIDLTEWNETNQAIILAGGALMCSLSFAYMQEKVFLIPGFHYHGFMTLLTTLTYCACAMVERWFTGKRLLLLLLLFNKNVCFVCFIIP